MKTLILAALVAVTAAPAFAVTDSFGAQFSVENASFVEIDSVRSQDGGRVEILDGSSLTDAVSLGGADVRPGFESDVRVQLTHKPFRDNVLAVLYDADGEVTATRELRVRN